MVTWNEFIWFGAASVLLSIGGAATAYFENQVNIWYEKRDFLLKNNCFWGEI